MFSRLAPILGWLPFFVLATGIEACREAPRGSSAALDLSTEAFTPLDRPVSYEFDVKPVLESRCVVCHACYDAPS